MKKFILPLCVALALAFPAFAQDEETARWRQRAPIYNAYDLDKYENAHIVKGKNVDFSAADEDKDGVVSRTEMRHHLRDYERAARDNHSRQDARMRTDYIALRYRQADSNGDGHLSADELKVYESQQQSGNGRPDFYYRSSDLD